MASNLEQTWSLKKKISLWVLYVEDVPVSLNVNVQVLLQKENDINDDLQNCYYVPNQQLRNIIYIDRLIVKSYVKTDGIRNLS